MALPVTVPSVPWMPERAWTTCVSEGAISGLARANYVPFAPQPLPPGMSEAAYEALDPAPVPGFGIPPPDDCFPRYVMWREAYRNPDFAGGQPGITWNRQPGWDFRNDCEPTCNLTWGEGTGPFFVEGACNVGPCLWDADLGNFSGGSGSYLYEWRIWNEPFTTLAAPIWIETTPVVTKTHAELNAVPGQPFCAAGWQLQVTDVVSGCVVISTGVWQYCCV